MNHYYNKRLRNNARENRKNMTLGEIIVWDKILKRSGLGVKFKRQRPMGPYILDFYSAELNVALEIDGYTHRFDETRANDKRKSEWLLRHGIILIRIPDEQVFHDLSNLKIRLFEVIRELKGQRANPPPAPSKGGGIISFQGEGVIHL